MDIKTITRELGLRNRRRNKCPLENAGIQGVDYKDVELIKHFLTEKGKIIPKRITGLSTKNQTHISRAIKKARNLALISYVDGYVGFEDKPGTSIFDPDKLVPLNPKSLVDDEVVVPVEEFIEDEEISTEDEGAKE